jgi:hypothetical protein
MEDGFPLVGEQLSMCILAHWSKKTASYVKNTEDIWEGIKA